MSIQLDSSVQGDYNKYCTMNKEHDNNNHPVTDDLAQQINMKGAKHPEELGKVMIKKTRKTKSNPPANNINVSFAETNVAETLDKMKKMEEEELATKEITEQEKGVLSHLGEYSEEPYTMIESYFRGQHLERLVRHQIESYNHFINFQISRTIQMFNPVSIRSENDFIPEHNKYLLEMFVNFENFKLFPPQIHENNGATKMMLPQEAKLRNFTYASTMYVDLNIQYVVRNTEKMDTPKIIQTTIPKINIGKMPIMLKSAICMLTQNSHISHNFTGECPMDCGGYFIIKGSEKTVLGQERAAENRIYCFDGKNTTKWTWFAEIKSVPDFKCISPKQIEMMIASKNNGFGNPIFITIPRIKQPIELFVLFRALGVTSDKKSCEYIVLDIESDKYAQILQFLQASIIDAGKYMTQEDALRHITASAAYTPMNMDKETGARKKREFTVDVLNNDLFPHCKTLTQKLYLIGYMANKLIQTSFGWRPPDDRDSYLNKRIDLTGTLLNNLFRNYFNKLVKEMQKQVIREINNGSWRSTEDYENIINMTNIYKIIKSTTIENGITRALSTGDFSIKQANSSKVGVAQVLNRLTYMSSLSHLRRINTPLEKSGELIAPRKLHNTTFGFLCLTGDCEVLMANRVDMKKIKDIRDGDWVNTVNRENLLDEPSPIHNWFCKMPDKLFEITTISGRKIKATADHPFLINKGDGKYEMVKLCDLQPGDPMVIRHMVKMIPDENRTEVRILEKDVVEHYRMEMLERGLLNRPFILYKLKIIARLIGALNTDGHIGISKDVNGDYKYYNASFYVGEEYDAWQLAHDIQRLEFGTPSVNYETNNFEDKQNGRITTTRVWRVGKSGVFAYLMYLMGGFCGKKTNMKRCLPEWLLNAELSVKREFLSAFQGGDGCRISYQSNKNSNAWKIHMGYTSQTTHNEFLGDTEIYMKQIVHMFSEFNIKCHTSTVNIKDQPKTQISIAFDTGSENLARYVDIINYTYCEEKRRISAAAIEHIKIRAFNQQKRCDDYQFVLKNYGKESTQKLVEITGLSINQITKIISKNKKGLCPEPRYTSVLEYENFVRENMCDNGCACVPILSIVEVEPELVYDFTTYSENHSFVSQSFIPSNCPVETPEGQSIGVVKNISYMTHITIPTNSASLYEYAEPYITKVDDVPAKELYNKVKVFINGAWIGISNNPLELYAEMKNKKYRGIINIYTSVVFDYKMAEIRICSDGGRLTRPLLKVRDGKALVTNDIIQSLSKGDLDWNEMLTSCKLDESVIEYIDPEEQNYAMIAMKSKKSYLQDVNVKVNYTHCEIHQSTIFGVLASCAPYPDHNQAPRNTYQCLDPDELVWMADGTKKALKNIEIGNEVMTFHPTTFELTTTTVVNQFVRANDCPIYELHTLNGKCITATEDHKFMTNQGWKTVKAIMRAHNGECMSRGSMAEYFVSETGYKRFSTKESSKNNIKIGRYDASTKSYLFESLMGFQLMPDGMVADITVESNNHSFLAGEDGFLSSNCAMVKQAIGIYALNFDNRMDKSSYILNYPSRPLVDTRLMNFIHLNRIPSGCQVHVAIASFTGYNQEDSILINKGSIDRGMFSATIYHTEKDEDKNIIRDEIIRCKPDPTKTKCIKFGNYDKLNSQGFIEENYLVENRDIIIAKIVPIKENRNDPTKTIKYEDQSKSFRTTEETYIDKNYTGRNGDGYNFAKVRVRTFRKPVLGDKFACAVGSQQVLTQYGWIEIQDIDITKHKVCTLSKDGNMCYEHPINKFEYDHDGQMYSIQNKQVHMVCTLNHKLYVTKRHDKKNKNYQLIEAQHVMGKMVRFQKSLNNIYPDVEYITLGETKYKMDDWLQLLGMFISDGSTNGGAVYLSAFKERKIAFNTNILSKLNIEFKYNTRNGYFSINKGKYPEIYKELDVLSVGATNKYLPEYIWNLSKRQCIILLEALIQGDGNTLTSPKGITDFNRYYTTSIKLADEVMRLSTHCGWSAIVKLKEEANHQEHVATATMGYRAGETFKIIHKHDYYMISIIKLQNQPWINKKHNDSNIEELIDYKGKVYCIEMPSSNLYYFRETKFSPSMLSGNSRSKKTGLSACNYALNRRQWVRKNPYIASE